MQPTGINPGQCPRCGGELAWKASVGSYKAGEIHFYQCDSCHHIYTVDPTSH